MQSSPSMLKSALIGGVVLGAVGGIPFVGAINCACCALVMGGGFLAAFLYSRECRDAGAEFRPGNGALLGLVTAPFYAVTTAVVGTLAQLAVGMDIEEQIAKFEESGAEIPPAFENVLDFVADAGPLLLVGVSFGFWLCLGLIFSTIGGLIGGAVFKTKTPEPPAASAGAPPPPLPPAPPAGGGTEGPPPAPGS